MTCDHPALAIFHTVNDLTCYTNRLIIIIIIITTTTTTTIITITITIVMAVRAYMHRYDAEEGYLAHMTCRYKCRLPSRPAHYVRPQEPTSQKIIQIHNPAYFLLT